MKNILEALLWELKDTYKFHMNRKSKWITENKHILYKSSDQQFDKQMKYGVVQLLQIYKHYK